MADIQLPKRLGEGFAGNDRFSNNEIGMNHILNQVAGILTAVKAIGTDAGVTDITTLKAALAALDGLLQSEDSKV
jgi:hypothetical protein